MMFLFIRRLRLVLLLISSSIVAVDAASGGGDRGSATTKDLYAIACDREYQTTATPQQQRQQICSMKQHVEVIVSSNDGSAEDGGSSSSSSSSVVVAKHDLPKDTVIINIPSTVLISSFDNDGIGDDENSRFLNYLSGAEHYYSGRPVVASALLAMKVAVMKKEGGKMMANKDDVDDNYNIRRLQWAYIEQLPTYEDYLAFHPIVRKFDEVNKMVTEMARANSTTTTSTNSKSNYLLSLLSANHHDALHSAPSASSPSRSHGDGSILARYDAMVSEYEAFVRRATGATASETAAETAAEAVKAQWDELDITIEEYLAARLNVLTRCFKSQDKSNNNAAQRAQAQAQGQGQAHSKPDALHGRVMVPVLDSLNHHAQDIANIDWKYVVDAKNDAATASSSFVGYTNRAVAAGEELLIDYSQGLALYPDPDLYAQYGFVNGDGSDGTAASVAAYHYYPVVFADVKKESDDGTATNPQPANRHINNLRRMIFNPIVYGESSIDAARHPISGHIKTQETQQQDRSSSSAAADEPLCASGMAGAGADGHCVVVASTATSSNSSTKSSSSRRGSEEAVSSSSSSLPSRMTQLWRRQREELVRYLMFDDGYKNCIEQKTNNGKDNADLLSSFLLDGDDLVDQEHPMVELKRLKLTLLEYIAQKEQYWAVVLGPRRKPHAAPPTATTAIPAFDFQNIVYNDSLYRILSTCRLLALTHYDYQGNATQIVRGWVDRIHEQQQKQKHSADGDVRVRLEPGDDALEFRTAAWLYRLSTRQLYGYGGGVPAIEQAKSNLERMNAANAKTVEWFQEHVKLGELQSLQVLVQYSMMIYQDHGSKAQQQQKYQEQMMTGQQRQQGEITLRLHGADPTQIRQQPCPIESQSYLLA